MKTMEDYSSESCLLGFIRFACKVGYPKKLMPDEGSQLVKGCEVMKLKFYDIKHRLHERYGARTTKQHGRPTRKYGKIMKRPNFQMRGTF